MIQNDIFNWSYYDMLLIEDRKMIDEYVNRMSVAELNSFMQRLIEYYKSEETLEVSEDKDLILVSENNRALSKNNTNIFNSFSEIYNVKKLPYEYLIKILIDDTKVKKEKTALHYFLHAIYKYFEDDYKQAIQHISKDIVSSVENLYISDFHNYLADSALQKKLFNNHKIGWKLDKDINKHIHEIFIKYAKHDNRHVKKIYEFILPAKLYTYRLNNKKMRMGIAFDKKVLRNNVGYGHNFKISLSSINIKDLNNTINFSSCIRNACYWKAQNAKIYNFDNKTGIIWFNGRQLNDRQWLMPNNHTVENNTVMSVSFLYTTDAYAKLLQRMQFNKKMRNIILHFESDALV